MEGYIPQKKKEVAPSDLSSEATIRALQSPKRRGEADIAFYADGAPVHSPNSSVGSTKEIVALEYKDEYIETQVEMCPSRQDEELNLAIASISDTTLRIKLLYRSIWRLCRLPLASHGLY